jgi:hypothetical protein
LGSGLGKFGSRTTGVGTPTGVAVGDAPAGELPGTSEDGSWASARSTGAVVPMRMHTTRIEELAIRVFALAGIRTLARRCWKSPSSRVETL